MPGLIVIIQIEPVLFEVLGAGPAAVQGGRCWDSPDESD